MGDSTVKQENEPDILLKGPKQVLIDTFVTIGVSDKLINVSEETLSCTDVETQSITINNIYKQGWQWQGWQGLSRWFRDNIDLTFTQKEQLSLNLERRDIEYKKHKAFIDAINVFREITLLITSLSSQDSYHPAEFKEGLERIFGDFQRQYNKDPNWTAFLTSIEMLPLMFEHLYESQADREREREEESKLEDTEVADNIKDIIDHILSSPTDVALNDKRKLIKKVGEDIQAIETEKLPFEAYEKKIKSIDHFINHFEENFNPLSIDAAMGEKLHEHLKVKRISIYKTYKKRVERDYPSIYARKLTAKTTLDSLMQTLVALPSQKDMTPPLLKSYYREQSHKENNGDEKNQNRLARLETSLHKAIHEKLSSHIEKQADKLSQQIKNGLSTYKRNEDNEALNHQIQSLKRASEVLAKDDLKLSAENAEAELLIKVTKADVDSAIHIKSFDNLGSQLSEQVVSIYSLCDKARNTIERALKEIHTKINHFSEGPGKTQLNDYLEALKKTKENFVNEITEITHIDRMNEKPELFEAAAAEIKLYPLLDANNLVSHLNSYCKRIDQHKLKTSWPLTGTFKNLTKNFAKRKVKAIKEFAPLLEHYGERESKAPKKLVLAHLLWDIATAKNFSELESAKQAIFKSKALRENTGSGLYSFFHTHQSTTDMILSCIAQGISKDALSVRGEQLLFFGNK